MSLFRFCRKAILVVTSPLWFPPVFLLVLVGMSLMIVAMAPEYVTAASDEREHT